jgi:hypothetical protein
MSRSAIALCLIVALSPATALAKRKRPPKGPSVATVQRIIKGGLQAQHESWLGPESIEVTFTRKTQVRKPVKYDPYANDPNSATGPVRAWPVRAWVTYVNHHDETPEDDTRYTGCSGHLDETWPHDSLYMFFKDTRGHWTYLSSSAKPGVCPK